MPLAEQLRDGVESGVAKWPGAQPSKVWEHSGNHAPATPGLLLPQVGSICNPEDPIGFLRSFIRSYFSYLCCHAMSSSAARCHSTGRNGDRYEFPRNGRDRLDLTRVKGGVCPWSVEGTRCGGVQSLTM